MQGLPEWTTSLSIHMRSILEEINNLLQNDLLKIVTKIGKKINQVNLLKAALWFFEANMR